MANHDDHPRKLAQLAEDSTAPLDLGEPDLRRLDLLEVDRRERRRKALDCVRAAYDIIAEHHVNAGITLSLRELQQSIPGEVLKHAVRFGWTPNPATPPPGRRLGAFVGFEDKLKRGTNPAPQAALTEQMGAFRVPQGYVNGWLRLLSGRILYWQSMPPPAEVSPGLTMNPARAEGHNLRYSLGGAESANPHTEREENLPKPDRRTKKTARTKILKSYMREKGLHKMLDLAEHFGIDPSALYAMVRGDQSRYGENTLDEVLRKLRCSREQWETPSAPEEDS